MDTGRKLASVRRIAAIDPIEGADKIVCVTVDGWKLVSGKENGFQVGDLVIYFEIDSFLPVREEFEWMRDRCYKNVPGLGEGFRVKTIKLRGQVSQGLIVPMSDFLTKDGLGNWYYLAKDQCQEYGTGDDSFAQYVDEGSDLTEFLGVKKYEKPIPAAMQGRTKGNFPSFIRKTDEERIQNNFGGIKKWIYYQSPIIEEIVDPYLIDTLNKGSYDPSSYFKNGDMWFYKTDQLNPPEVIAERSNFEMTLKLDGSSCTIYHNEGQIGVCSRNLELKRDATNPFWEVAIYSGLMAFLIQEGSNVAVQGELMGPGVQGNREGLPFLSLWIFNVFNIDEQRYMTPAEREKWFEYFIISPYADDSVVRHAPSLGMITWTENTTVHDFLDFADRQKSVNHDIAEGVVFKSVVPNGPSFKAISNKFLLKETD